MKGALLAACVLVSALAGAQEAQDALARALGEARALLDAGDVKGAAAKLDGYLPPCVIICCIILPVPTASAMAEPDMPAKMMLWTTLTCARPPRKRPTIALQNCSRRSVMLPVFMNSAARMNSGTASSTWLEYMPFSSCSAAVPRSRPAR